MTKRELIHIICSVNRSATPDFLAEFAERDLSDYMRQLTSLGLLPAEFDETDPGIMSDPQPLCAD